MERFVKVIKKLFILVFIAPFLIFSQDGLVWVRKVPGGGLGDPFDFNPQNHNTIFCSPGNNQIWRSTDRGKNWHLFASLPGGLQIKDINVHPIDTLMMLIGQESGPPDRIMKTTNGGLTWFKTWNGEFSYYGVPIAYERAHPNLVYTMGWDSLWRSTDFGSTWTFVRTTLDAGGPGVGFDRWDCGVIRPDSANILYVGDITNGFWKSTDSGLTWTRKHFHTGEYPVIKIDPFNPLVAYSARWIGVRGFMKTTDGGETWFDVPGLAGRNTWGMDVSRTHPGFVCTGTYGDALATIGGVYISNDHGQTWKRTYEGLTDANNYGMLSIDSVTVFALQANGIWKLEFPIGNITVVSPNGGEIIYGKSLYNITWTVDNPEAIDTVRIEITTNNGVRWDTIATRVPSNVGSYPWLVPNIYSNQCRIRIVNILNHYVNDVSDNTFTIRQSSITILQPNGGEIWKAGNKEQIKWSYEGYMNINIEYTTNNGNSWIGITKSYPVTSGYYSWYIPHTPSSRCRIKVFNTTDPTNFDFSDTTFNITDTTEFIEKIIFTDNGGISDTLYFGQFGGATDSIDEAFGEIELPPKPGVDTFDVRFRIPSKNGTKKDIRDVLSMFNTQRIYTIEIQPGPSGYPFTLCWNPATLPSARIYLLDELSLGDSIFVDMHAESSVVISNPIITSIQVVTQYITTLTLPVNRRWNLVAVPLRVDDFTKSSVYPTAISNAYAYENVYVLKETLSLGVGYWLKFDSDKYINITGMPHMCDTIDVFEGWNLIGGLSVPIPISEIRTEPLNIVISPYYGYQNGYIVSDTIGVGKSYWVKVSENGKLILCVK